MQAPCIFQALVMLCLACQQMVGICCKPKLYMLFINELQAEETSKEATQWFAASWNDSEPYVKSLSTAVHLQIFILLSFSLS